MSDRRLNSPHALASLAGRRYASDLVGRVDEETRRAVERLVAAAYRSAFETGARRAMRESVRAMGEEARNG